MKYFILYCILLCFPLPVLGQENNSLTLKESYRLAKAHYPVLQQDSLLRQQLVLALKNLSTQYLPQISLQARATYQSDVTRLPIKFSGVNIPEVAKDQYKAILDIQQLLFNGGSIKKQKNLQQTKTAITLQQQQIAFHQLKNLLSEQFAELLITKTKIKAVQLQQKSLTQQLKQTRGAIKNGIALPARSDELQAAVLQSGQHINSLQSHYLAGIKAMSLLTGKPLDKKTKLVLPKARTINKGKVIHRPELKRFTLNNRLYKQKANLLEVKTIPKISAFAQGGYGRPGLNMLTNDFDEFYMVGLRLHWNIWNWNKTKRQKQSLKLDKERLHLKRKNFLLTTHIALAQALSSIQSLEKQIRKDKQIVQLRHKITETASSQLRHGTITPTEYLIKLNNETTAVIRQQTHIIQLRFAKINYQLLKNK